jgi:anti-sigma factor RsiW
MRTCAEITEMVTDFEEGVLSWADWAEFRVHIALCPACREYLRQMRLTVEILEAVEPPSLPADTRSELMDTFRRWRSEQSDGSR